MVQMHYRLVTKLPHGSPTTNSSDSCRDRIEETSMKRILGAIIAGAVVFAGVYALAASLSVSTVNLGAGSATITAACTGDTLQVDYSGFTYSGGEQVSALSVVDTATTPTPGTCNGLPYRLDLTGSSGSLGSLTGTVSWTTGSTVLASTSLATPVSAASITGVALVIG
jgi:hypothetical protein